MIEFDSSRLPDTLPPIVRHWIYNILDCCLTYEIDEALALDDISRKVYSYELSMYPMIFTIMDRGCRVDKVTRLELLNRNNALLLRMEDWLNRLGLEAFGHPINARSPQQLQRLFYTELGIYPIYKTDKGIRRITVDREALEKLEDHLWARPFVLAIMAIRDIGQIVKVLRAGVSEDGRMRFFFNPAATETERWSSSKNPDRQGMNFQNITEDLRVMFIPDPGYKLAYIDLIQAESYAVAYLSGDENYIAACESGDLHTYVCKLIWPNLPWSGDIRADRKIADEPYYRHFSRRDIAKRGGHATNYMGKAYTLAKILRVEQRLLEEFQRNYLEVFSGIPRWHHEIQSELSTGTIISPTGFARQFLARLNDEATLREAVAFKPQNIVAWTTAEGLRRIFHRWDKGAPDALVKVVGNVHDAGLFQYRDNLVGVVAREEAYK